eukprot:Gregarina_sp_Poly_1__5679@NODE_299_length_9812_cov_19_573320_g258_i0_p2_GENE_NODE_299_length_9812_cov_19_573320_g258_i0NODE_299_length_9812_cov_19_573320_g258_i0_p2_ORF_typecomplete_len1165_score212_00RCC1/PF00415_18/4_4e02RCC1/PF00415_18/31RCC1/PF00415_18/0_58RCC1/PF00415_18/8_9e08RCC1/PF00415_18/0_038RCC1/PF00415_18/17RCC1_2/PF13540_6/1_6e02RCC1_2/PF13540_6/1_4e09RCC1_2/PF13540_6/0_78RCC1_2/PF13540_6/12RCC1_2/PF13540_6/0_37Borrelia_P83/PF05262_11/5_4e05_NODE_299_length_9812_cov_19_573320_g258_
MFRGHTAYAGEWPNFLRAVSGPKPVKQPHLVHQKWQEEIVYWTSINFFLSILNRPRVLRSTGRRRSLLAAISGNTRDDLYGAVYNEVRQRDATKQILKLGFQTLLPEAAAVATDLPVFADPRRWRIAQLLLFDNYSRGHLPFHHGWSFALFVFLRRYCISALARLARGQKKMTTGADLNAMETAKKLTKELKFMVAEMDKFLGETITRAPVDVSSGEKAVSGTRFNVEDFASMVAPFEVLTGHKSFFDARRITLERSCFELRQIAMGTAHSLLIVGEDLQSFLGLRGLRRQLPPTKELQEVLGGQISCVFGWGANDQFQLTVEGPRAPVLLHTPYQESRSGYLRRLPNDVEAEKRLRPGGLPRLDMAPKESDQVFERQHGLHLIKFKWMRPKEVETPFRRKSHQARRSWRRGLQRSMSVKQRVQLLKEVHSGEETTDETDSDIDGGEPIRLHRLAREVDYTFRIVQVQCGEDFSVALTNDGKLFSWGDNSDGRCGQGRRTVLVTHPTLIEGVNPAGRRVLSYSVGLRHCMALAEDDLVFIWGAYPMIHLLTNPPMQNTFVPTQVPLWIILAEGRESKLDLIRRREETKRSLLEPGWKYEFVEIKPGDLSSAQFDQHTDKLEVGTSSEEEDGRLPQDDSQEEMATEPRAWRTKRENERREYLEKKKSDSSKASSDSAKQQSKPPGTEEPKSQEPKESSATKGAPSPDQGPSSKEKETAPSKGPIKLNGKDVAKVDGKKDATGASAAIKSAGKVDGKKDSAQRSKATDPQRKSNPKNAKVEQKTEKSPPPKLQLPPEFEIDEPPPIFHYSWRGMTKNERIWLNKLHMIKQQKWHVAAVKCGVGFNVIQLRCPKPDIKDLLVVWGRNECGQLGLYIESNISQPTAGTAGKAAGLKEPEFKFPGLRKAQSVSPVKKDQEAGPKLPTMFSLKVQTPVARSQTKPDESAHTGGLKEEKPETETAEKRRQEIFAAPKKSPFFGWVPEFLVLGSDSSLLSPMKIRKLELGDQFMIALMNVPVGGRFLIWGGLLFTGADLIEDGSPTMWGILRLPSPCILEHPELADRSITDVACCGRHVCLLCADGSIFGFDRLNLEVKKKTPKVAPPKHRFGLSIIEFTPALAECCEIRPILYQYRYRRNPRCRIQQVRGSGHETGLKCIYALCDSDLEIK